MKKKFGNIFKGGSAIFSIMIMCFCFALLMARALGFETGNIEIPFVVFGMTALTQANNLQDILKWEELNNYSREVVTVAAAENLSLGAVVGKIALDTCPTTGTAGGTNTGSGACTGVTAGAKAKLGVYTLKCIIAQSGAGIFSVEDPDGYGLPNAVAAVAYVNDQINFTINDGSPDYVVGDSFTIEIEAGSGKIVEIDFDAVDGSQDAYGITIAAYDATDAAVSGVVISRNAIIADANLVWPTTSPAVSAAQKAAALAQLAAKGIIATEEV